MSMDQFWSLFHRSSAQGTRSTVLAPMTWALALMVIGLLVGKQVGLPAWGLILFGVGVATMLLNFVAMNWYFAIKDPDALRSERFTLTKLAMRQKNFKGDSLIGFVRALSDDEGILPHDETATSPRVLIDQPSAPREAAGNGPS